MKRYGGLKLSVSLCLPVLITLSGCFMSSHTGFDGETNDIHSDVQQDPEFHLDQIAESDTPREPLQEDSHDILNDPDNDASEDSIEVADSEDDISEVIDGPQTWIVTLEGGVTDCLGAVVENEHGDIYVAGSTQSFGAGQRDMLVAKLDRFGHVLWQKTIGGSGSDYASSIVKNSDGNFTVAGRTNSVGDHYGALLVKLNADGSLLWQKYTESGYSESFLSASTEREGVIALAGRTTWPSGNINTWIATVNGSGDLLWQKTLGHHEVGSGSTIVSEGYVVVWKRDSGLFMAGMKLTWDRGYDMWIANLDSRGNILWQKKFGIGSWGDVHGLSEMRDGSIVVAGRSYSDTGRYDLWVLKLRGDGEIVWQKTADTFRSDSFSSVIEASDGGIIVAGKVSTSDGEDSDPYLVKFDGDGRVLWQRTYRFEGNGGALQTIESIYGGLIVVGCDGIYDIIMKLSNEGEIDDPCSVVEDTEFLFADTFASAQESHASALDTNVLMSSFPGESSDSGLIPDYRCPDL